MTSTGLIRVVVVGVGLALVAGLFTTAPAAADSKTVRLLAGIAVGALVYEALGDDHDRCRPAPPRCSPPPPRCGENPRYDPPAPWQRWSYESPRRVYDDGYRDGWRDGYGQGRQDQYTYDRGYVGGPRTCYREPQRTYRHW